MHTTIAKPEGKLDKRFHSRTALLKTLRELGVLEDILGEIPAAVTPL
jgi:hypothetical protein